MNTEIQTSPNSQSNEFHRFQLFHGARTAPDQIEKTRTVGMAYIRKGQDMYTLRLWTFLNDKFFLLPSRKESGRYLIMTREPVKNPNSRSRYFWNIVGNATVVTSLGCVELDFDVLGKPIFMSLFPEAQPIARNLPDPVDFESFEATA